MSNKIKLILTDMDGSLLNENKVMPQDTEEVIEECLKQDIIFGVASGRQLTSLASYFPKHKDQIMFVCHNGNYAKYKGETIHYSALNRDLIPEIVEIARNIENVWPVWCDKDCAYIESNDPRLLEQCSRFYHDIKVIDDLLELTSSPCMFSICCIDGAAEIYPLLKKFESSVQVMVSADIWIDMFNHHEGKGIPVKKFQEKLNITPEETLVFGDYLNDISLLQCAKYSYVMENAHPDLFKYANFTAPSNEDCGVTKIIKQFLYGEE